MDINELQQKILLCENEIKKEIVGQKDTVRLSLLALITGGNVLLEGMPGLGKTRLVNTISKVVGLPFKRIQFTPDLMPGDITGTNIIEHSDSGNTFRFEAGPIFANLILADEINRATPNAGAYSNCRKYELRNLGAFLRNGDRKPYRDRGNISAS